MKIVQTTIAMITFGCALLFANTGVAETPSELVGLWSGKLKVGTQELPLVFNITESEGQLKATLDSPAQGAKDIPVSKLSTSDAYIVFEVKAAQAKYVATLASDNQLLVGRWLQGPNELPLSLNKVETVSSAETINRPQEPKEPYGYKEELVKFTNQKANITLAGTLTMPNEGNALSAVVLITGSGPQDRDQTFMGHKTFWVLADYLTNHGIAVLRFDDRGIAKSEGNFADATSADFADDVSAAVDFLATHKRINKNSIGLIGHSEGGLIAPITASINSKVSFIVSLAGPGLVGDEIAVTQVRDSLLSIGLDAETANSGSQITKQLNKTVLANKDKANLRQELLSTYEKAWLSIPQKARNNIKAIGGGQLSDARLDQLSSNWTKYFLQHDPKQYLSQLEIPTLVLFGSKDAQLNPSTNIQVFENILAHKNTLNQIEVIDGLNHLFQPANTGLMNEYVSIETTFAPVALKKITTWINRVSD